jgi:predicted phosphate transport protein (TIGR00153 family)
MTKKNNNYFDMFISIADDAIRAALALEKAVKSYDVEKMEKMQKTMHEIEHGADEKKHALMKHLASEFITPIEREDIVNLVFELDDVLDLIEEVTQLFYMYNIQKMRLAAIEFATLLVRSTQALKTCFDEFEHFLKSEEIIKRIVEVNVIEEIADALYMRAVRDLYTKEKDPITITAWTVIFDKLERACDRCEHVADTIESVMMKNT